MLQNISISNKCCSYDIFYSWKKYKKMYHGSGKKKSAQLLYYNITTNKNVQQIGILEWFWKYHVNTEEDREEWL